jgi:hypothetical protein
VLPQVHVACGRRFRLQLGTGVRATAGRDVGPLLGVRMIVER